MLCLRSFSLSRPPLTGWINGDDGIACCGRGPDRCGLVIGLAGWWSGSGCRWLMCIWSSSAAGCLPNTVRRRLSIVPANPVPRGLPTRREVSRPRQGVPLVRVSRRLPRILSPAEVDALSAWAAAGDPPDLRGAGQLPLGQVSAEGNPSRPGEPQRDCVCVTNLGSGLRRQRPALERAHRVDDRTVSRRSDGGRFSEKGADLGRSRPDEAARSRELASRLAGDAGLGLGRGGSSIDLGEPTETERVMAGASAGQPSSRPSHVPATVADVMRPALSTVEASGHLAAAAYLMKHAGESALVVIDDEQARRPIGLITDADISRAVADRLNVNEVRIHDLMNTEPTVIVATTSIHEAAEVMVTGHFRHLPVVSDVGLIGIVDIGDVCRALLDSTRA